MRYSFFIFDCDGVILDSNKFKVEAMGKAVEAYPEGARLDFVEYFKNNFGKSRYVHADYFFEAILKREPAAGERDALLKNYAELCLEGYATCDVCAGAVEFAQLAGKENCWVVSGSDESELRHIFSQRGLSEFYKGILGSPQKKHLNVSEVLKDLSLSPDRICMVGDSWSDYEAAQANGIDFVFCSRYSNTPQLADFFYQNEVSVIDTLKDWL